jgi:hypothetical protein
MDDICRGWATKVRESAPASFSQEAIPHPPPVSSPCRRPSRAPQQTHPPTPQGRRRRGSTSQHVPLPAMVVVRCRRQQIRGAQDQIWRRWCRICPHVVVKWRRSSSPPPPPTLDPVATGAAATTVVGSVASPLSHHCLPYSHLLQAPPPHLRLVPPLLRCSLVTSSADPAPLLLSGLRRPLSEVADNTLGAGVVWPPLLKAAGEEDLRASMAGSSICTRIRRGPRALRLQARGDGRPGEEAASSKGGAVRVPCSAPSPPLPPVSPPPGDRRRRGDATGVSAAAWQLACEGVRAREHARAPFGQGEQGSTPSGAGVREQNAGGERERPGAAKVERDNALRARGRRLANRRSLSRTGLAWRP